jgi:hypothetical protein
LCIFISCDKLISGTSTISYHLKQILGRLFYENRFFKGWKLGIIPSEKFPKKWNSTLPPSDVWIKKEYCRLSKDPTAAFTCLMNRTSEWFIEI